MKKLTVAEIREAFLRHFESKGCTRVNSSSLVPLNDPTLLFTSAGMVQFKDVFTGVEKRAYTKATTAQKCLRAGGKHNDLENVGFTARHHTFFEMMGNFSFGDYFKKEAITWAWQLVTEGFGMPVDRLHVTIFRTDDEAFDIWNKVVGVPKERIYRFDEKDNFWSAGDVGPCGPCTEIYFDRGEKFNTGDAELDRMGGDGGRYLEFYNLVFMQYNRDAQGNLSPLPKPSVDTGLGLERTASILQDVPTNYDTDVFHAVFQGIEAVSGKKYVGGMVESAVAFRVIADHLRAISFLIADGVLPSNEGRGYVLRRILRRAVRYGTKLGFEKPFLEKLVPYLRESMDEAYPELQAKEAFVRAAVKAEEEKFFETLKRGEQVLADELKKLPAKGELPGSVAFLLYDSFGFPFDLTGLMCRERGYSVDEKVFQQEMEKQRDRSRSAQDDGGEKTAEVYHALAQKVAATQFLGYDSLESDGKVLAILQNGQEAKRADSGAIEIIFDRSPFYGESGGQTGDRGELLRGNQRIARVTDVKKPTPELTVVRAELESGFSITLGESLHQSTTRSVRLQTMANHSATHLLHWALRHVLGAHVKQAGSLVSSELLRFDFTHFKALTEEERQQIEDLINEKVFASQELQTKVMNKEAAVAAGAMALFGEKYSDDVRVVSIGDGFSTELCGGTHVKNTSQIGCFVLISEAGVAAGVRRIVAYTGQTAVKYLKTRSTALDTIREHLKATSPEDAVAKVERLQQHGKDLEKQLSHLQAASAGALAKEIVAKAVVKNGVTVVSHLLKEGGQEAIRVLGERLRDHLPNGAIVLGAADPAQSKAFLLVTLSSDLTKTHKAGALIQAAAPYIEGKGGGKPEQAQAGGTKIDGLEKALSHILSMI